MTSDDLRARVDAVVQRGLAFEAADPDSVPVEITNAVMVEVDAEVDAVARRGAAAIAAIGADVRAARAERDRYRLAWQSARERAQAYGEGILRHVEDRDAYKGWMDEQAERAARAEAERDKALAKVTALEACYEGVAADALAHGLCAMREHGILQRAERAEATVERVRALAEQWQREDSDFLTQAVMQAASARLYRALTEPTTKESQS